MTQGINLLINYLQTITLTNKVAKIVLHPEDMRYIVETNGKDIDEYLGEGMIPIVVTDIVNYRYVMDDENVVYLLLDKPNIEL